VKNKYVELTPELYEYLVESGARQDELLARVERETEAMGPISVMQIAPDQGALMTLLVRAIGARLAVEVGTFTGYSAICIARGLPDDGRLVCHELNEDYARIALQNLTAAGLADRIEMRVGPALGGLRSMPDDESIDFAFVDADKVSYPHYYDELLARLRPGGLMLLDNVLLGGRVLDPADDDEGALAMRELNARVAADERVDCAMVSVADGLTIVRRRGA
jgi:predicted O-methyltransferase YrrM